MVSGLYKYIVFDPIERSTGQGLRRSPATASWARGDDLPNSRLGRRAPLVRAALLPQPRTERTHEGPRHRWRRLHRLPRRRQAARGRASSRASSTCARPRTTSPARSTPCSGDLLDREALRKAMRGCDAVVHLAAAADVDDVALRSRPRPRRSTRAARSTCWRPRAARASSASSTRRRSGSTAAPPGDGRRGPRRSSCPTTSTRRPSSRARCTAARTRRSTAWSCTDPALRHPLRPARAAGRA